MKLVKTSLYSALITMIRTISGFVSTKVVAIYAGPGGVALVGQFINFIAITLNLANGAINTGVVKYTAEYEGNEVKLKELFSTSLRISILCSSVIGILLLLIAPSCSLWIFHTASHAGPVRALGAGIILYSLNTLFISILNGNKQIKSYTIINIAGTLVGFLLTVILIIFYKVEGALYALALSQSLIFFLTFILIIRKPWFNKEYFKQRLNLSVLKKLGGFSLMTIVSTITVPLAQLFLRNMIIYRTGINTAGYWQGMTRISDAYLLVITTSISTYYLPKLSSLRNDDEIRTEILSGIKKIMPVVFLLCTIIFLFRHLIISILFTHEFYEMEDLFLFQMIGDFFKIGTWMLGYLLLSKAMVKEYIFIEVISSATYITLSYFLINAFGIKGVTIAFSLNYLMLLISLSFLFRKFLLKPKN